MTPNQQKEELSKAYLSAVAAAAGFAIGNWSQDQGCVDASIKSASAVGAGHLLGGSIDVQMKASARQDILFQEHVTWTLSKGHYDNLRAARTSPLILMVLVLPEEVAEWVHQEDEHLLLRHCAYWLSLTGRPPLVGQDNITVRLPRTQRFSPSSLRMMLEQASAGAREVVIDV